MIDPSRVAELVADLNALHARLQSWREVALHYPGVKPGTLCRIAKGGYLPEDRRILRALRLVKRRKRTEMEKRISGMARETRKAVMVKHNAK